jgi:hypothetical protein
MRCSAKNVRGEQCRSTIIVRTDPPLCRIHTMTVAERKAQSARGGLAKGRGKLEALPLSFADVRWIVDLIVAVANGTRRADEAEEYLAPVLTRDVIERNELRQSLEKIEPPPDEPAPLDRLERAREHLRRLYAEGRVFAEELPPGVLLMTCVVGESCQ